jgi:cobalt-zinc-cadmium efflux system protein
MGGKALEKGPHNHHQAEIPWGRRLILTMILNLIIPLIEIYAGIIAGSMALISDALHNLGDLTSLMISYAALKIGGRGPSLNQTFGYRRVEVMAAVFNVALLFGAAFYIAAAGWGRLKNPVPIQGTIVIWVALAAFAANGLSTLLLHSGAKENLNLRGAFLHMLVDALTSIGVALLGVIWIFRPWYWLDPLVSWAIVALILYSGWGIIKEALLILMNAAPSGIDLQSIQQEVEALEGIKGLHHLHVWNPSSGSIALAAHVIVPDQPLSKVDEIAARVRELLYRRFKVDHPILQFEMEGYAPMDLLCSLCGQEGPVALQKQPLEKVKI